MHARSSCNSSRAETCTQGDGKDLSYCVITKSIPRPATGAEHGSGLVARLHPPNSPGPGLSNHVGRSSSESTMQIPRKNHMATFKSLETLARGLDLRRAKRERGRDMSCQSFDRPARKLDLVDTHEIRDLS